MPVVDCHVGVQLAADLAFDPVVVRAVRREEVEPQTRRTLEPRRIQGRAGVERITVKAWHGNGPMKSGEAASTIPRRTRRFPHGTLFYLVGVSAAIIIAR